MELIQFVSLFSALVTVGMHCTGLITCRKYVRDGSVGTMSHLPFLSAALVGGLWMSYGLMVSDSTVILVNTIGAILQSLYFVCYYKYADNLAMLGRDCIVAVGIFLLTILYFFFLSSDERSDDYITNHHPSDDKSSIRDSNRAFGLGVVCNIFTVLFFASPLSKMSEVIKDKNTSSMSLPLSIMSLLVTMSWFFYGVLVSDIFILMPNIIGFLLCIAQLSLFMVYPSNNRQATLKA